MSSTNEHKVEHMLRTRLARQAADMAVKAYAGFPQPQILRLEEILPTTIPTTHADSEAAFTYKSFTGGRKIVAFIKLFRESGRWVLAGVGLCEGGRQEAHYSFRAVWPGEDEYPDDCPQEQGPLVRML